MELALQNPFLRISLSTASRIQDPILQARRRTMLRTSAILPETVASVAVATVVVGAATTLLVKRLNAEKSQLPVEDCEDCSGSGICSECRGEGFVLQKLSQERAERARMTSNNAATRFTSGLPRKWSYCTKCSSGRNCSTCGGSGKLTP